MPSEFPMKDPRNVWQNQPTEPLRMSAEQLRCKVQRRQSKARFEALYSIVFGLTLAILFAWTLTTAHEFVLRLGFGILSLWSLYFAYQAYRRIRTSRLAPDATLSTTLESYRNELEKQRDFARHVWRRTGLPFCFLGLALIIVPELIKALGAPRLVLNVLPVGVLLAIWFAIFIPQRKRRQQKLRQEIDELRAFAGETH